MSYLRESFEVLKQLGQRHIPNRIAASQGLVLAGERPPAGNSIGYSTFYHRDSVAATKFRQKISETRA